MLKMCDEFGECYLAIINAVKVQMFTVFIFIDHAVCLLPQLLFSILVAML